MVGWLCHEMILSPGLHRAVETCNHQGDLAGAEISPNELARHVRDLDVKQDWPRILSLGEQQRLAFGRLLLNAPRFVVLDEATSALDVKTERHLYELLLDRDLAFISVGHRPTLLSFHDTVLELIGNGDWRLIPTASYDLSRS